jgi:hypothetical protein
MRDRAAGVLLLLAAALSGGCESLSGVRDGTAAVSRDLEWKQATDCAKSSPIDLSSFTPSNGQQAYFNQQALRTSR